MDGLPTGTVTLLFSDIEGSTLLLTRLGTAYADALHLQREILRAAWAAHDGIELGTEGDSFFVAFTTADAAAAAAIRAQEDLATASWPDRARVRVRIGIHTGTPMPHEDGYVGIDVHRAARISAAAHGGQVVISSATAELVDRSALGLVDLGWHALKDLPNPEHLYQLEPPGHHHHFPPVKSLGSRTNLPRPATPLVGRERLIEALVELTSEPGTRLVTLTGPGGTGKTRLAVALAERTAENYPDGVFFVPLETVTSTEVMWTSIATSLDLPPDGRIPPGLFDHVAHRTALLILDNLEQLDGATTVVTELLQEAPGLRLVATSRHALALRAEQEFPVPPLDVSSTGVDEPSGAVELFIHAARRVRPGFELTDDNRPAVVGICRRLDGLPLALELATARLKLLSPQALLARLDQALDLTDRDPSRTARQHTLREAIEWSYRLLDQEQRTLFRCLGAFSGGADLDAVQAVAHVAGLDEDQTLDALEGLVSASLITATEGPDGEPRITMLNTVHDFAQHALTGSSESFPARRAAAAHYADLVVALDRHGYFKEHDRWLAKVEADLDNLRRTLTWLLQPDSSRTPEERRHNVTLGRLLAANLSLEVLTFHGYYQEAHEACQGALAAADDVGSAPHALCQLAVAHLAAMRTDYETSQRILREATPVLLAATPHELIGPEVLALRQSWALYGSSWMEAVEDRPANAKRLIERALALPQVAENVRGHLQSALAGYEALTGDHEVAVQRLLSVLEQSKGLGDEHLLVEVRWNLADTFRLMGRPEEAMKILEELAPQMLSQHAPYELLRFAELCAETLALSGNPMAAAELLGAAEAMRDRIGTPRDAWDSRDLEPAVDLGKDALGPQWDDAVAAARERTVEQLLERLVRPRGTA